jgi:hypothetical protein
MAVGGPHEVIAAWTRREGEESVGGRFRALTLRSLVLGCVVSHSLRRACPVPERASLLQVRIVHQAIYLPPFIGFQAFLVEN